MRSLPRGRRDRRPRPVVRKNQASFQVNMGRPEAGNKSSARLAKTCLATLSEGPRSAPRTLRRSVDALRNAGLYSARMYHFYGPLLTLAWPAVLPYQMVMALLKRTTLPPFRERLGFLPGNVPPGGFWIHAVSVGEVRLALTLLPLLRERFPGAAIHVTTGTTTGRALAAAGGGAATGAGEAGTRSSRAAPPESIAALPFDLPFAMVRRSEEHTSELQSRSDLVC